MNVAVDTNVLVRAVINDDPVQSPKAAALLRDADRICVSNASLCEFVWVLLRVYQIERADIARAIRALADASNVALDRPSIDLGLEIFEAGGDFADGVIAHEGAWLGADQFATFDRKAGKLLQARGRDIFEF